MKELIAFLTKIAKQLNIPAMTVLADGPLTVENGNLVFNIVDSGLMNGVNTVDGVFNKLYGSLGIIISGVTGICAIALVGVFAVKAFNLASVNHPAKRADAIKSLIYTLIGAALLGGASAITGIAYWMLK